MAHTTPLPPAWLGLILPYVFATGCNGDGTVEEDPTASMSPEDGRGKADRVLYGSCEDACGTYAIGGTCWCDEYCSVYGDCCDDFEATCVTCDDEIVPREDSTCEPIELIGEPVQACAGSSRFGPPTIAAGPNGYAVGCESKSRWSQVERYVALFDGDGQSTGEVQTKNGVSQDHYRSPLSLSGFGDGYQLIYDYNCATNEQLAEGHGSSCIDFQQFDQHGSATAESVSFTASTWNDHPVLGFNGNTMLAAWSSRQAVFVRAFTFHYDGGQNRSVWDGPGAEHDSDITSRTALAWNGQSYGVFKIERGDLYFGEVAASGGEVRRAVERVDSARYYADAFNGALEAEFAGGRYYVLAARRSTMWPGTSGRVTLEAIEDGRVVGEVEIPAPDSRYATMVRGNGRFHVFTSDGTNLLVTTVDDALEVDPALSDTMPLPTGFLAGQAKLTPDGDVLIAYVNGSWQVSSDNAVYVQRLRING